MLMLAGGPRLIVWKMGWKVQEDGVAGDGLLLIYEVDV
jgi:hypothetical protein